MGPNLAFALLFDAALVLTAAYACVRGDTPERFGAALNIAGTVLSILLYSPVEHRWEGVEISTAAVDVCMTIAFFILAIRTARYWPVWCFGLALANVFVHLSRALLPEIRWVAYSSVSVMWAYLALIALALGVRYEAREEWRRV